MKPADLIAQAARLEARARAEIDPKARQQLRGEALVCRGMAWILESA